MKYPIYSTCIYRDPSKLIEQYPALASFGFEIVEKTEEYKVRIRDENGKPMYQIMTRTIHIPYINIESADQLFELIKAVDQPLVIEKDGSIEIYDAYRE